MRDGTTYYYQVTAVGAAGEGGPSNERGGTAGIAGGFDAPMPQFAFAADAPRATARVHVPFPVAVTAASVGKVGGSRILLTLQVHDAADKLVFQKVFDNQDFGPGQSRTYSTTWTPEAPGKYTVQAGAFGDDFAPRYSWEKHAEAVTVESGSSN